ncbi:Ankyrin repeat domain containing protein [Pandoravirus salinus]|uniref:Ankyrin repeat domain containing protein n=1 Tax=Pandoravirus salinus TaxID=1349410 RepID=S4VZM0_9VIRU|nr:ankyrin repeat domain [Pandoravirus salinus]AGO85823.1 Ankyrin repeat domain containing protein [Pandoravirus salinus]
MRRRRVDMASLPPEVIAAVVSWLGPRDHASAVLASRRFGVLTIEERGRLHFARFAPKALARMGSLDGLCYWHGVDPWRIDIHCLRAAAKGGHRALVEWILDRSIGGGCPTEALCAAAKGGQVDLMRWLVDEREAVILKETLANAISSKRIDAVCIVLDRAYEIDHRQAAESGICCDDDGDDCDDDDNNGDDDDNDDNDDILDRVDTLVCRDNGGGASKDHSACGRDWDNRAMRMAARTDNVDIMELVYARCYGRDPEVLCRPLRAAAASGATAAVKWILARCDDREAADDAFEAAFNLSKRDCAVAILARWSDIIDTAHISRYSVSRYGGVTVPVLDAALAVSTGARPSPWPLSTVDAFDDPDRAYDALLVHRLSEEEFRNPTGHMLWSLLSDAPCDDVFCWVVDNSGQPPATHVVRSMAHKGMIGRLAYCRQRGLLTPAHVVEAMAGAAAAGRIDVLAYVWSSLAEDLGAADAIRANVQKVADAAAKSGDWGVVDWLRQHVDQSAHCTAAAFSVAANEGHATFLRRLYAVGADRCLHPCDTPCGPAPSDRNSFLYRAAPTPCGLYDVNDLWRHVARGGHYDVVQVLRKHGALDGVCLQGDAALCGHVAICAIDVAVNGPYKRDSMIQYAVQARDRACLSFALANGSTWEPWGPWSVHPFYAAAKKGSRTIMDLLRRHEAQIECCFPCHGDDEESDYDSESD